MLDLGNARVQIIGELGNPSNSEYNRDGYRTDTFSFVNGYSSGTRAARAVGHGAASVVTLGLWEVVGTSIEGGFNGSKVNAQITYDQDDTVIKVVAYEDGELIVDKETQAAPAPATPTQTTTDYVTKPEAAPDSEKAEPTPEPVIAPAPPFATVAPPANAGAQSQETLPKTKP